MLSGICISKANVARNLSSVIIQSETCLILPVADRVEVIVKDNASANKLQQHIWESPLRSYRSLSIRLLEEHISK